jgi:hypothetical protein
VNGAGRGRIETKTETTVVELQATGSCLRGDTAVTYIGSMVDQAKAGLELIEHVFYTD